MQNIQPLGKATNEVQRAEIDRLRDELARERGQHARDKEGQRRQHDNKAEIMKLDHAREMDREKQQHQTELDRLKGGKC